ncbi:MAG: DUF262 domain-containing protein [Candidatus Izemoplasmatales bacterium]|nr:DUF262 domain-containing protein [Candidatus Izemoplasmatales bacterium]
MTRLKDTKVYTINDFYGWYENKELVLAPKYQRKAVWNSKAESYLIDTILRGLPIPQVFVRQSIDPLLRKTQREVIDGQQRLRTIIKYINNEFPIMKQHNSEYGGLKFDQLEIEVQRSILEYQLPVELIMTDDDNIVYDMFVRVNTNSYVLNRQELRNAKFWGDFKVLVYKQSSKWRAFFQENRVFKDSEFLRMKDSEFISSLLILLNDGIKTETPKFLDEYYKKYDNDLPNYLELEQKCNEILDFLKLIYENQLFSTQIFSKYNYFYTLFAYTAILKGYLATDIDSNLLLDLNDIAIKNKLEDLESVLENDEYLTNKKVQKFIEYHKIRTTNETERKLRIKIFAELIYGDYNEYNY